MAATGTLQDYKSRVFQAQTGKIRSKPISDELRRVLDAAAGVAGVSVRVTSGGQAKKGTKGPRTGSTRHDLGNAADLQLEKDGRVLDFTKAADRKVFETFAATAAANGATGIGAGLGYMGPNTIHVGFGPQAVWGAGGSAENAPDWLVSSVKSGWKNPGLAATSGPTPPASVSSLGSRTLRLRAGKFMQGDDVKALQETLKQAGYDVGNVDGVYGPATKKAVEAYQKDFNAARARAGQPTIAVDGVVGPDTREPLVRAMEARSANLPGVARYDALQRQKLPGAAPAPFDKAQPTPDRPVGPLGASVAPRVPDRALGPLAAPRGNLAMTAPQPGIGGPTPAQFEAAKQQIRDQQGFAEINPRDIGVDPRNPPVNAGTGGGVAYQPNLAGRTRLPDPVRQTVMETNAARAERARANSVQNLRGNLLAGSVNPNPAPRNVATTSIRPANPYSDDVTRAMDRPRAVAASARPASVSDMVRGNSAFQGYGTAARADSQDSVLKRALESAAQREAAKRGTMNFAPSSSGAFSAGRPAQSVSKTVVARPTPAAPGVARYNAAVSSGSLPQMARPSLPPPMPKQAPATFPTGAPPNAAAAAAFKKLAPPAVVAPAMPAIAPAAAMALPRAVPAVMGLSRGGAFGAGATSRPSGFMATGGSGGFRVLDSDRVSPGSKATFGRKQSDGTVRGTTSSGKGYSASNAGGRNTVSVNGKTYRENANKRGYSRVF